MESTKWLNKQTQKITQKLRITVLLITLQQTLAINIAY